MSVFLYALRGDTRPGYISRGGGGEGGRGRRAGGVSGVGGVYEIPCVMSFVAYSPPAGTYGRLTRRWG